MVCCVWLGWDGSDGKRFGLGKVYGYVVEVLKYEIRMLQGYASQFRSLRSRGPGEVWLE